MLINWIFVYLVNAASQDVGVPKPDLELVNKILEKKTNPVLKHFKMRNIYYSSLDFLMDVKCSYMVFVQSLHQIVFCY